MTDTSSSSRRVAIEDPRKFGLINGLGLATLYRREVGRFIKVWMQTLLAPVVSTLLLMTVFKLAFGNRGDLSGDFAGIQYENFLAPGLVIMTILQNSFQNTSSSLTISKVQGNTVDFLMPPLSPLELTLGFIAGAATRGFMVACLTGIFIHLSGLADLQIRHIWAILWFGSMASIMLAAIGAMGGIWADKFDHLAAITNFVIVPLTFLSGTFYDINVLQGPFLAIAHADPFFYLIDGFRYGFLGEANSNLMIGVVYSFALTFAACFATWMMFRSGYKLKA